MVSTRREFLASSAALSAGLALPSIGRAALPGLPDTMVWSTYDVGSTGYIESFDAYKDAAPIMKRWDPKEAGTGPMDAPFHAGAVRYLKEAGLWTAETDAWHAGAVARQSALRKAWASFKSGQVPSDKDAFGQAWLARRADVLKSL